MNKNQPKSQYQRLRIHNSHSVKENSEKVQIDKKNNP
jgi:hypothetical protein